MNGRIALFGESGVNGVSRLHTKKTKEPDGSTVKTLRIRYDASCA